MKNKYIFLGIALVLVTCLFFLNKSSIAKQNTADFKIAAMRAGQNGLINPLLEYEISQKLYIPQFHNIENKINLETKSYLKSGKADKISVYFRILNDGQWFGISEDENFFPASLLKTPLMIAYYKMAEDDPSILEKQIPFNKEYIDKYGDFNEGRFFSSPESLVLGNSYSVEQLIDYMIKYSDNNAKNLLILNLDSPQSLFRVYTDLGMATPPELKSGEDILSSHEFAKFFRVLYNASYLNRFYSKKALTLLTQTNFSQGISKPLPNNVIVAHKFGEYQKGNFKQLHDCGIVYFPGKPYILCLMSRGKDFTALEEVLTGISSSIYSEMQTDPNLK